MGVDARGCFATPKGTVNEKQIKRLAGLIQRTCGGLTVLPPDPGRGYWKEGKLGIEKVEPMSEAFIKKEFGEYPPGKDKWIDDHSRANIGKLVYDQDGPPLLFNPSKWDLWRINFSGRYYSPEYARGHWPTIRSILSFIRFNVKDARIFYGGDSSGCLAREVDSLLIASYDKFYYSIGHDSYSGSFGSGEVAICDFCESPMWQNIFVGGKTIATCACCGLQKQRTAQSNDKWEPLSDDLKKEIAGLGD